MISFQIGRAENPMCEGKKPWERAWINKLRWTKIITYLIKKPKVFSINANHVDFRNLTPDTIFHEKNHR